MSRVLSHPVEPPRSPAPLGRLLSLSGVLSPLARQGGLALAGRVYPWMIALGYAGLLALSRSRDDVPPGAVVASALRVMSWASGAVASAAAADRDPDHPERGRGLLSLASERGIGPSEQRLGRALSTMRVVARAIGLPGTCLALVASVGTGGAHPVTSAAALVSSVAVYAALFGVVVGGLARLSALVSPRHGRILFALVVLGPWILQSGASPSVGVVGLFSALLGRIAALGGAG